MIKMIDYFLEKHTIRFTRLQSLIILAITDTLPGPKIGLQIKEVNYGQPKAVPFLLRHVSFNGFMCVSQGTLRRLP
jgi:hypothetical protein